MTVTLSIKNVPDELAARLKARAERNHRSLQGELMAIIEAAVSRPALSIDDLYKMAQASGLIGPAGESARLLREDRDDPAR